MLTASALDFERYFYKLSVRVLDGKGFGAQGALLSDLNLATEGVLRVLCRDVNEPPSLPSPMQASIAENAAPGTLVLPRLDCASCGSPFSASDPDRGDALTFYNAGGPDAHLFLVDAASGAVRVKEHPQLSAVWEVLMPCRQG